MMGAGTYAIFTERSRARIRVRQCQIFCVQAIVVSQSSSLNRSPN